MMTKVRESTQHTGERTGERMREEWLYMGDWAGERVPLAQFEPIAPPAFGPLCRS